MKKSFLKRAMAAAIAVPVALTQTVLCGVFAADTDASSELKNITMNTFMDVAVDADIIDNGDGTYVQESNWNKDVYTALGDLQGTSYTLDTAALANSVESDRWSVDFVQRLLANSTNAVVNFNADDVTITADVEYMAGMLGLKIENDGVLDAADFTINGQVVVKIDTLGLYEGKTITAAATMTVDGKEMSVAEVLAYAQDKIDLIAEKAAEAGVDYSELVAYYNDTLANAQAKYDEAMAKDSSESYTGTSVDDVIAQFKDAHADSERVQNMPNTVSEALAKDGVADLFNEVLRQANEAVNAGGYTVAIELGEIETLANGLYDVEVVGTVANGAVDGTMSAKTADDLTDLSALYTYFNEQLAAEGLEVKDGSMETYKLVEVSADADVASTSGSVELNVKRVITFETEEIEETTEETTEEPTEEPTADPTEESTEEPTADPTEESTEEPTADPTEESTEEPTADPTEESTEEPTADPTEESTEEPTADPTEESTEEPTADPTEESTEEPTSVTVEELVVTANDVNFYFSHDEEAFAAEDLISEAVINITTTNADGTVVEETAAADMSLFTFGVNAEEGAVEGLTPAEVYNSTAMGYVELALDVYYDGVLVEGASVYVFIGVKGDADLDGDADANDASYVLQFAADFGGGNADAVIYTEDDELLETFAFFLAEVSDENQEHDSAKLDATDAAFILTYAAEYGAHATDPDFSVADTWDAVLNSAL